MRFLTFGRSLWVTGFVAASPHLIARTNAEDTKPAIFLTVFGFIARGVLVFRVWPPDFSNRVKEGYISTKWSDLIVFSVLILFMIFRPQGLMPPRRSVRAIRADEETEVLEEGVTHA
jgi:hypothetical protein